jgi:hypothetical protein
MVSKLLYLTGSYNFHGVCESLPIKCDVVEVAFMPISCVSMSGTEDIATTAVKAKQTDPFVALETSTTVFLFHRLLLQLRLSSGVRLLARLLRIDGDNIVRMWRGGSITRALHDARSDSFLLFCPHAVLSVTLGAQFHGCRIAKETAIVATKFWLWRSLLFT